MRPVVVVVLLGAGNSNMFFNVHPENGEDSNVHSYVSDGLG